MKYLRLLRNLRRGRVGCVDGGNRLHSLLSSRLRYRTVLGRSCTGVVQWALPWRFIWDTGVMVGDLYPASHGVCKDRIVLGVEIMGVRQVTHIRHTT